jgi:hypothetical protein
VKVEDDNKVKVGLGPQYKSFKTSILTRDSIPSFVDLTSMLLVEERNLVEDTNKGKLEIEGQALYNSARRARGRQQTIFGRNKHERQGEQPRQR